LGIPNAFPFKEQILAEREEVRRRRQQEKESKRKNGVETEVEQIGFSTVSEEKGENGYVAGLLVDSDDEDVMDEEIDLEEGDGEIDEENDVDDEDDDKDEEMEDIESSESEWEGIEYEEETS